MYFTIIVTLLVSMQSALALSSKIIHHNPNRESVEINKRARDIKVVSVKKNIIATKVRLTEMPCYNDDYCPDKREVLERSEVFLITMRYYDIYDENGYVYENLYVQANGKSLAQFQQNLKIKDHFKIVTVKNPILAPVRGCYDMDGKICVEDSGRYRELKVKKRFLSI